MAQVNTSSECPEKSGIADIAQALMRKARKGALATIDRETGGPYASLVTLASDSGGAPVFLISNLARHTRNLSHDPRASILIDDTGGGAAADGGDPLQGARLSLSGRAEKTADASLRRRFLARQPHAEFYAGFSDFSFWRLELESAHFIGGFGRIVDLSAGELLVSVEGAEALMEAEADIIAHMNDDHSDAIALYAEAFGSTSTEPEAEQEPGQASDQGPGQSAWRMTGLDPQGCDLLAGAFARRISFARRVLTPQDARAELVRLVNEARTKLGSP